MNYFSCKVIAFILLAVCFACPSVNYASSITITGNPAEGTENLGNFVAGLVYNHETGADIATLTIRMTNTSPVDNGGYLTGFAFNTPTNVSLELKSSTNLAFTSVYGINASPFGDFGIGVVVGGSFLGGGSPTSGIPVGGSADFVFSVTGENLADLSASSLVTGSPSSEVFSVARFKGFDGGGSDKVPGRVTDVPEPNVMALLLAGLICLVMFNKTYFLEKVSPIMRYRGFFQVR